MKGEALSPPRHGGRLQAKLVAESDGSGRYEILVSDATGSWEGTALVAESDGAVNFGAWQGEPAAWLIAGAHSLLRSAWQRRRTGSPWPRRLTRWRPAPGASTE